MEFKVIEKQETFAQKPDLPGKKRLPKKILVVMGIVLALAVTAAGLLVYDAVTNTYEKPVKMIEKYDNRKTPYTWGERIADRLNGFATSEIRQFAKFQKKTMSDEQWEQYKKSFKENKDNRREIYGSDYKITYEIVESEKKDREAIDLFSDGYISGAAGERVKEFEEFIEQADSEDWNELAQKHGVSVADAQKWTKVSLKLAQRIQAAEVTEMYVITVTETHTGNAMEKEVVHRGTFSVIKIDGRWVSCVDFEEILSALRSFLPIEREPC